MGMSEGVLRSAQNNYVPLQSSTVARCWQPFYIAKRTQEKFLLESLPYLKGRVLDVGCGLQPHKGYFKDYVGIDFLKYFPTVAADARFLPFSDASFDSVICMEVLEHINNPPAVFNEIVRVLKIGGIVYITVPMYWYLHYAPLDFWRFTPYSLLGLCKSCGLLPTYLHRSGGLNHFIACRISESLNKYLPKFLMCAVNKLLLFYTRFDKWNNRDAAGWVLRARRNK